MIFRTAKQIGPAYFNCLRTSPMGTRDHWMPRDQGNWWREEHQVYPQIDGSYGFESEQTLMYFILKWS